LRFELVALAVYSAFLKEGLNQLVEFVVGFVEVNLHLLHLAHHGSQLVL
jgi:hypothetical protein